MKYIVKMTNGAAEEIEADTFSAYRPGTEGPATATFFKNGPAVVDDWGGGMGFNQTSVAFFIDVERIILSDDNQDT